MSKTNTAKKATPALRVIHGTGNPKAARLEDLRGVIETMRVARKNGIDLTVQLHVGAVTLDATNAESAPAAQPARANVEVVWMPGDRFTKVSKDGKALPVTATDWEGVYDAEAGLIWGRACISGEFNWKDACKKASETTLCGAASRAPTVQERFALNDLGKHGPALDTRFFAKESGWEWTSTVDAESPSGCAWSVGLGYGVAFRYAQVGRSRVRAVRSGQPLGL